jgi:hypothetical protein
MATATTTKVSIREKLGVQPPALSLRYLNGMVFGEFGVGKTHFLGTAEDHPETSPLLILDVDGGVQTLRKRKGIDVIQIRSIQQFNQVYLDLLDSIENGELYYKTIGIDTLTEFQSLDIGDIMEQRYQENPRLDKDIPDQYGWGKSSAHIRKMVRLLRDLPCNTIFTCHLAEIENSLKQKEYYPMLPGKLKKQVPGFLDFVGFMKSEVGENDEIIRSMQFLKTDRVAAKQRDCGFDDIEIDPTIPMLWDKMQEYVKAK